MRLTKIKRTVSPQIIMDEVGSHNAGIGVMPHRILIVLVAR